MYTLGINAVYRDASACLVQDGTVIAAAQESRFVRGQRAHLSRPAALHELPFHAVDYCLKEARLSLVDVNHVAYAFNPHLLLREHAAGTVTFPAEAVGQLGADNWDASWDPVFLAEVLTASRQLAEGAPHHLMGRFRGARADGPALWHHVPRHLAHAAAAFHTSPFQKAAVMTLDGNGERATTSYHLGHGSRLDPMGQVVMPHSLGHMVEQVTAHLGFERTREQHKVTALGAYGKPRYLHHFREIIRFGLGGQYALEPLNLSERLGPPRTPGAPLDARHQDIASSLQVALEEAVLTMGRWLHRATGAENLCLAGCLAQNALLNARIRDRGPFKRVWVPAEPGAAGTAVGAALWIDAQERGAGQRAWWMENAFLGPHFVDDDVEEMLRWSRLPYRRSGQLASEVAEMLARGKMLGWFQGRMEFGTGGLGARSILASPQQASMQARLNDLKGREHFLPVCAVVLDEEARSWFATTTAGPFMRFVLDLLPSKAATVPAVRHADGTGRVLTVTRTQNAPLHDLLKAFHQQTGVPMLISASFHTTGQPLVCSPRDAVEAFCTSPLDALVMGPFILEKERGPARDGGKNAAAQAGGKQISGLWQRPGIVK